jgi:hypothetical protein
MTADVLVGNAAVGAAFSYREETVFRLSPAYNDPVYIYILSRVLVTTDGVRIGN